MVKKIQSYDGVNELMIQILMREGPMDFIQLYDRIMETGLLSERVMLSRRQVMARLIWLEKDGLIKKAGLIKTRRGHNRILYDVVGGC